MGVREINVKFHKNCENTGKILKIWHSLSWAPIRKFLWCYYKWLITFLALEKCKKRMRYCLNYSGTIKVFVHWKLKLLNFLISCFDMTSRRPYLCTEQWIGGHVCVQKKPVGIELFSLVRLRANATTPNIVAPTKLLRACWQWCANGCNNAQQCWYLGRIQPISLRKPCVMSVRGPNNVGRVGSCWLKSLTSFNFAQQHAAGCANGRNM